jgi:hypothetical protein
MTPLDNLSFLCFLLSTLPRQVKMECNLYLAPSSIPGAGMGIFSGSKAFEIGESVSFGDIAIPIFEFTWHNGFIDLPFLWDGTFLFDIILVSLLILCCGLSRRVSDSLNLSVFSITKRICMGW